MVLGRGTGTLPSLKKQHTQFGSYSQLSTNLSKYNRSDSVTPWHNRRFTPKLSMKSSTIHISIVPSDQSLVIYYSDLHHFLEFMVYFSQVTSMMIMISVEG